MLNASGYVINSTWQRKNRTRMTQAQAKDMDKHVNLPRHSFTRLTDGHPRLTNLHRRATILASGRATVLASDRSGFGRTYATEECLKHRGRIGSARRRSGEGLSRSRRSGPPSEEAQEAQKLVAELNAAWSSSSLAHRCDRWKALLAQNERGSGNQDSDLRVEKLPRHLPITWTWFCLMIEAISDQMPLCHRAHCRGLRSPSYFGRCCNVMVLELRNCRPISPARLIE